MKIKIFDTKGTNVVPTAKSTVTVGSAAHCDVVIDHASVQSEHMRAWIDGGRIWVQDLSSASGTYLNGIRLPALKPMLVRDLDVIKLGESPAALSLEANMVRAPVVRAPTPAVEEITQTDIRAIGLRDQDLEKRREELAKVSRDLAELKLQLQMARLEKTAGDELRKQVNSLREELRLLAEEKENTREAVRKMAADGEAKLRASEEEAARRLEIAETEIREMRDIAGRKLGHWKVDMVAELSRQLHVLSLQKAQEWITRPLSKDMMFEWEAELNQMLHRTLLSDGTHPLPPVEAEHTSPGISAKAPTTSEVESEDHSAEVTRIVAEKKGDRRKAKFKLKATHLAWIAGGVLVLFTLALRPWNRVEGNRSLASQGATTGQNKAAMPQQTLPQRFNPKLSKGFKKTYTDNVLYTENFVETELNSEFRQRWMSDLIRAGRGEWHVDDRTLAAIVSKESAMIQDLKRLREGILSSRQQEGIAAMRAREVAFQRDLQALLRDPALVEQFHRLKTAYYRKLAH